MKGLFYKNKHDKYKQKISLLKNMRGGAYFTGSYLEFPVKLFINNLYIKTKENCYILEEYIKKLETRYKNNDFFKHFDIQNLPSFNNNPRIIDQKTAQGSFDIFVSDLNTKIQNAIVIKSETTKHLPETTSFLDECNAQNSECIKYINEDEFCVIFDTFINDIFGIYYKYYTDEILFLKTMRNEYKNINVIIIGAKCPDNYPFHQISGFVMKNQEEISTQEKTPMQEPLPTQEDIAMLEDIKKSIHTTLYNCYYMDTTTNTPKYFSMLHSTTTIGTTKYHLGLNYFVKNAKAQFNDNIFPPSKNALLILKLSETNRYFRDVLKDIYDRVTEDGTPFSIRYFNINEINQMFKNKI
jgi:hypothetical protein